MTINLTDPANHPANSPLTGERIERVIEALESSLKYRNGSTMDHVLADAVKGLRELREVRKSKCEPVAQIEVISGVLINERWMHSSLPNGWHDLYASRVSGNSEQLEPVSNRDELNSPVTPDGWILVSERMPEVGDIVLTAIDGCVNVGEAERSGANYRYFTSVISGRELPATHWQPLPAAPKEVG